MIYCLLIVALGIILCIVGLFQKYDGQPWIVSGVVLVLVAGVIMVGLKIDEAEKAECERIMSFARTNSDSIKVMLECGKNDDNTVIVPAPIYIQH